MLASDRIIWLIVLVSAAVIDYFFEYPNSIHPVVFTGKLISFFDRHRLSRKPGWQFLDGMISLIIIILVWIAVLYIIGLLPPIIRIILYIYILKSTFSVGELAKSIRRCETESENDLRTNVGMIVSRDVKNLDRDHLLSAAFESGSENIVDSVVSPIFYFILFGIYGAVIFRVVNTADAMIGYHSESYEYFGKFSARVDDVLNFIPARIFGFLLLLVKPRRVLNNLRKYRKLKINGMYSMATMAALFDVSIEKVGYYSIAGPRFPGIDDLKKLEKVIFIISYFFIAIAILEVIFVGPWWS